MILLSVGPGPGAVRVPEISRDLAGAGHRVEVSLGRGARGFVGPAAFADSARVVDTPSRTPEVVVLAPATVEAVARLAHGLDGDPGPVPTIVAPELDRASARHPAVRRNVELLRRDGWRLVGGTEGGMASAAEVAAAALGTLGSLGGPLSGLRFVVSAGGTREPIDSVRFVGNRSSGKMGKAVAREAVRLGAEVSIVAANVETPEPGVEWVEVGTVAELREAVVGLAAGADVLVMAAAVSDFTPVSAVERKIRRRDGLSVEFVPTEDILGLVRRKNPELFVVGFAATYGDPVADAREKLASKGADIMVGNDISQPGIGFGAGENEVYIVSPGEDRFVARASKSKVARAVLEAVLEKMQKEGKERHGGESGL